MTDTVLLDAHETKRRLLQNFVPLAGVAGILAGVAVLVGSHGAAVVQGPVAILAGLTLIAVSPRVLVSWDLSYKGHAIRFENSVVFGERLFIDGAKITKGAFGYHKTLQGVIRTGNGAGDRITADSEAGLTMFKVRIVAQSAAP
jgi:hypothetical protein